MKALKIVGIILFSLWAIFITWQIYLARIDAQGACSYAADIRDRQGKPPGYNSDLLHHCR
jgi:hypothetical protein